MLSINRLGNLGRLANQMFQYASIKGIASNRGYGFSIPPKDAFGAQDELVSQSDVTIYDVFENVGNNIIGFQKNQTLWERMHHFDEELFVNCPDNVDLVGYFQTEKYFKHIEKQIRKDFTFKDEIKDECDDLIKQFTNPIALHIRRGDFIWNNKNHPPLSLDYYKSALELFDSDREVIIFSDDTEWCKEQELFADDRFAVAEGGDQFYDLCLMSMCDDFIIANSTFSWWGAWLGNRGKVVAPKQWFGEALDHDTKDLYCKGWKVL